MKHIFFVFALVVACGDDDGGMEPSGDAALDSAIADGSIDDSAVRMDSAVDMDGSMDSGRDSALPDAGDDAGDAGRCATVVFESLEGFYEPGYSVSLTRVPFEPSTQTLAEFEEELDLDCVPLDDSGVDDDDDDAGWRDFLRREGCGRVEFESQGSWPHFRAYDAATGQHIGSLGLEDAPIELGGCDTANWITGEILAHCADETLSLCR